MIHDNVMTQRIALHGLRYALRRQSHLPRVARHATIPGLNSRQAGIQHIVHRYVSTDASPAGAEVDPSSEKTWGSLIKRQSSQPHAKYNQFNRPSLDGIFEARGDQEDTAASSPQHGSSKLEIRRHHRREAIQSVEGTDAEIKQALYEMLRRNAALGRTDEVATIVEELVGERQEAPNLRIYAAMIMSNINSEYGSAADVERILAEMEAEGLTPDGSCYHNALRVLAVHPDCFLRDRIVNEMRERWMPIHIYGRIDVIAGLLREGLVEQAVENYTNDHEVRQAAPMWLKDMFIFHLCDLDEIDYALRMVQDRLAAGEANISTSVWYYLFDHACSQLHYEALDFIWRTRVDSQYLIPSSGQCEQALVVAARHGDVHIATEIFRILSGRSMTFEPYHYELLMQAHLHADELRTALTILCIMHTINLQPTLHSLVPFQKYIELDVSRCEQAFDILSELSAEREVPIVAMNCILLSLVSHNRHQDVIETYKSVHRISKQGPNVDTFNALFRSCHRNNDKKTAMFFAAEMVALKIKPNNLTYDRLLLVCINESDYEDGFRYYAEMLAAGYKPRPGTLQQIIKVCCDSRDDRAFEVVKDMHRLRLPTAPVERIMRQKWPEAEGELAALHA